MTDRQALFSRSPILSTLKVGLSKIATARLLFSMQHGNCCIAVKDPVFSISVTKKKKKIDLDRLVPSVHVLKISLICISRKI